MRRSAIVALVSMLLTACGSSTPPSSSDSSVEPGATTGTTLPPPLVAGPISAWGGRVVRTICVGSYQTYPEVPAYRFAIEVLVRDLLAPSGVVVSADAGTCDANLHFDMSLEPRWASYEPTGATFYTGAVGHLDMSLSIGRDHPADTDADLTALTHHWEMDEEVSPTVDPTRSPARTAAAYLANFEGRWAGPVLTGLAKFWGPVVAVELLRGREYRENALALLCTEANGPTVPNCEPRDYLSWRAWFLAQ